MGNPKLFPDETSLFSVVDYMTKLTNDLRKRLGQNKYLDILMENDLQSRSELTDTKGYFQLKTSSYQSPLFEFES